MGEGGVLRQLVDLTDQYVRATRAECLTPTTAPDHESTCQCDTHKRARFLGEQLDALIKEIRNG